MGSRRRITQIARSGAAFPVLTQGGQCPFCQQTIGLEAATRLKHFAEYVSSEAQGALKRAETRFSGALSQISGVAIQRGDITLVVSEVAADDLDLAERMKKFLGESLRLQDAVKKGAEDPASTADSRCESWSGDGTAGGSSYAPKSRQGIRERGTVFDPALSAELRELESRVSLAEGLTVIVEEIERKKRLATYRQCIDDTSTQLITRKSTELTKELVTDQLRNTFQAELMKLEFKHLAIEIQTAGGAKGALFHHLVFTIAPNISVVDVLSEGESRTLSLAAFLTAFGTAPSRSAIIFDDPVSSLDHVWRERIARRLVAEAKTRQVIVFTHDLLFLRLLLDESEKQGVACENQYVRREGVKPEFVRLTCRGLQCPSRSASESSKSFRKRQIKHIQRVCKEAYESSAREIYGFLREAWERAITEVLLYDVVERYRPSIETKKLRFLHDITKKKTATL